MNPDEQKIIELYKRTRRPQPPQKLDDKILSAARARLSHKPNNTKRIIWSLSSVAVLVLSVNIALKLVINPSSNEAPLAPLIIEQEGLNDTLDASTERFEASAPLTTKQIELKIAPKALKKQTLKSKTKKELIRKKIKASKERSTMPRMMPKMMQEPMAQDLSSSSMMADEPMLHPLPYFPFNVTLLVAQHSALNIKKITPNEIQITQGSALILSLKKVNLRLKITAYPNSESLGITINWGLKPSQLNGCINKNSTFQCPLNPTQTGYFENNQLIKVIWLQH